jgi:hypothetical protein
LARLGGVAEHMPVTWPAVLWTAKGMGKAITAPDKVAFEQARIIVPIGTVTNGMTHWWKVDFLTHVLPALYTAVPDLPDTIPVLLAHRELLGQEISHQEYRRITDLWAIDACKALKVDTQKFRLVPHIFTSLSFGAAEIAQWAASITPDPERERVWQGSYIITQLSRRRSDD